MKSTWVDSLSLTRGFLARKLIIAASACFAIVLGTASPIQAETFPVTGTAGFETGLKHLAFVTLDKGGQGGDGATVFWDDGTQSPGLYRCFEPVLHPNDCHVYGTHRYATPGTYTITIAYNEPQFFGTGPEIRETTTATISPIGDFVILSIGDSIASGEGDPVVEFGAAMEPDHAFWDDIGSNYDFPGEPQTPEEAEMRRACHRSLIAGPAQAAGQVGATNAITFVHFACSGATVHTTFRNTSNAVNQLRIARGHLPRIDVLLISAGANNMHGEFGTGFGAVLLRCLKVADNCSNDPVFAQDLSDSLAELAGEYAMLDQEIHCINPDDGMQEPKCTDPEKQIPKLVLITEYMDPTHVERVDNPAVDGFPGGGCLDGGIRENEWQFLYNNLVVPLNQQVRASPWRAVVGMQDDFMAHGYCSGGQRWIVTVPDSEAALGGGPIDAGQGTGHPNGDGHANYRQHIYASLVELNPPVTTANATVGGTPYPFGTWTDQDVEVTLSAKNFIREAGVKQTFYAVDNPNCNFADVSDDPANPPNCLIYGGPFTISTSGKHTVTFFSLNAQGNPEAVQSAQVWVDQNPPLSSVPDTMTIHQGQSASYTITVGHLGWAGQTIELSCTTDAELASCVMLPTSVTLDATDSNASVATVITTLGSAVLRPAPPARPNPFGPLGVLRLLLAVATATLVAAMARALRGRRWAHVTHFAALALLFGVLCAGCNSGDEIPGTPRGTHTVTITGTSGMTSNSVQTTLIVQ